MVKNHVGNDVAYLAMFTKGTDIFETQLLNIRVFTEIKSLDVRHIMRDEVNGTNNAVPVFNSNNANALYSRVADMNPKRGLRVPAPIIEIDDFVAQAGYCDTYIAVTQPTIQDM